jgi:hypothetical protein
VALVRDCVVLLPEKTFLNEKAQEDDLLGPPDRILAASYKDTLLQKQVWC